MIGLHEATTEAILTARGATVAERETLYNYHNGGPARGRAPDVARRAGVLPYILAGVFRDHLLACIGSTNYSEVLRRNRTPEYGDGACASHDFCDANQVMLDAFAALTGNAEPDVIGEDGDIMSRAWSVWRAHA